MSSLQEQLFVETASRSLHILTKDLQKKFEPKKGDRFNVKGITYEIGPPKFIDKKIQFEISSKIPGDELPESYDEAKYFKEIEKLCKGSAKKPGAVDMENIVRETRDQERKARDYVKLTYQYAEKELYDDKEIFREVEEFAKNPGKKNLPPPVPGANTLAGRLILNRLEGSLYEGAQKNVETLISANDKVRAQLKKGRKK
ncbi:MAG: hypothetical protein V3V62_03030 [bacterium]